MGRPVLFAENLFSVTQFPRRILTASSEKPGSEAWRVATGRRSRVDRWVANAPNTDAWVAVDCVNARAADMLAIDRDHNLAGVQVRLQGSADGAAWTDVFAAVVPAVVTEPAALGAAAGVRTHEGAWLKRFARATWRHWRVLVPAMGAGLAPSIIGIWLGSSWALSQYFDLPWDDERRLLQADELVSDAGWTGTARLSNPRVGQAVIKLGSAAEYELARYHLHQLFWRRRPMWIVHDHDQAERAVLAATRLGEQGLQEAPGWGYRQGAITWVEHEAALG